MLNFMHEGRRYEGWPTEDACAAGVPSEVITAAILEGRRAEVSAQCRSRIYTVASAEAQMNLAAEVALISSKSASARTDDEKTTLAGAVSMTGWISAMRAACSSLAQDSDADFMADAAWPEVPEDVVTLIARF